MYLSTRLEPRVQSRESDARTSPHQKHHHVYLNSRSDSTQAEMDEVDEIEVGLVIVWKALAPATAPDPEHILA